MRPTRLSLAGITRYLDPIDLDLSQLPDGIVAIVGDNGAGKSTVLECLGPAGVYRSFATYPGGLLSSAIDGVRDCWVDLHVDFGGHSYRHLHQLDPMANGGRGKSEATMWRDGVPVSERRTTDYDEAVAKVYPDRALFLAATFAAQGGGGDWIAMKKAERRDLFAGFLGLDDLQARSVAARAEKSDAEADIGTMRARLSMLSDADPEETRAALARAERIAEEADTALNSAMDHYRDLARVSADADSALATYAEDRRRRERERESRQRARDQDTRDITRWSGERAGLAAVDLDAIREAVERRAELAPEIRRLSEVVEERDRERQRALTSANSALANRERDLERAERDASRARKDAALVDEVPCGGEVIDAVADVPGCAMPRLDRVAIDCSTCPLLANAITARNSVPELDGTIEVIAADVSRLRAAVSAAEIAAGEADPEAARLAELRAEYDRHERLADDAHKLRTVPARIAELDAMIAAAEARLAEAVDSEADDEDRSPALMRAAREAREALTRAEAWGRAAREAQREAHATLARCRSAHEAAERDAGRAKAIADDIAARAVDVRDFGLLERALGRDGLQALEIDRAGPEVSDLLNELLSEVWGPRFRCQLVTTTPGGRGKVPKEVFDLEVLDGGRGGAARPIERFSFGERAMVSEALRLALAIYAGRRSGVELRTLFRDEADGSLQADLAERYPSMLRRAMALGGFERVYLVSHRPAVWEQADAQIVLADGQAVFR